MAGNNHSLPPLSDDQIASYGLVCELFSFCCAKREFDLKNGKIKSGHKALLEQACPAYYTRCVPTQNHPRWIIRLDNEEMARLIQNLSRLHAQWEYGGSLKKSV